MAEFSQVGISVAKLLEHPETMAAGVSLATTAAGIAAAEAETAALISTILGYSFAIAGGIVLIGAGVYLTVLMIKKARGTKIHGA